MLTCISATRPVARNALRYSATVHPGICLPTPTGLTPQRANPALLRHMRLSSSALRQVDVSTPQHIRGQFFWADATTYPLIVSLYILREQIIW